MSAIRRIIESVTGDVSRLIHVVELVRPVFVRSFLFSSLFGCFFDVVMSVQNGGVFLRSGKRKKKNKPI